MTPHAALGGRREGSCTDDLLCIISGVQWKSGKISAVFLDLSGHANADGRVGWLWHDVHESPAFFETDLRSSGALRCTYRSLAMERGAHTACSAVLKSDHGPDRGGSPKAL